MKNRFTLNDPLDALGMTSFFVPNQADLSCMTGGKDLYVSKVIHEAVVEVNEEGTVAAAATAVVEARPSPPALAVYGRSPVLVPHPRPAVRLAAVCRPAGRSVGRGVNCDFASLDASRLVS